MLTSRSAMLEAELRQRDMDVSKLQELLEEYQLYVTSIKHTSMAVALCMMVSVVGVLRVYASPKKLVAPPFLRA